MKRSDVFPSKFTKAGDLEGKELTATIKCMEIEPVGQDKEDKPVLYFEGDVKPIVLNGTNWDRLEYTFGDSDNWPGNKVTLYSELVSFQGKSMPGVRLRPIRSAPRPPAKDELNDEIAF